MQKILAIKSLRLLKIFLAVFFIFLFATTFCSKRKAALTDSERMTWWREARFGMFIHWGLYAVPAGEWENGKGHAEWIRHTARIPLEVYDKFVSQFNPVKFNAADWVRLAKDAGMKYMVITSKHHDGFCLFDSKYTDYDVMSTPFKRDIMKELSDACREQGLKMCWYHSIMDWHHPDYLPRRDWENRPAEGADFNRFVQHLKNQVRELLTNYGPIGVMWFDGEWENTWNHEYGLALYQFCREIRPEVIVNNRVDKGRSGMAGMTVDKSYGGDFGTPEQEIPSTGLPGVDWETCMTMNDHWGYNKYDKNFKSTKDLLQKLADIASKGGNFLLNIGPTAEGLFPQESIDRLREIGRWMKIHNESIYGTKASPFKQLSWGRCTQKELDNGITRLYLHVFDWPQHSVLTVPGIFNEAKQAYLLADEKRSDLAVERKEDALQISLPAQAPDSINSVVVLDIFGTPDIAEPPQIKAENDMFIDEIDVELVADRDNVEMRYTLDGSTPTVDSPLATGIIRLNRTAVVSARHFRDGKAVSGCQQRTFTKVVGTPALQIQKAKPGIKYAYFEGDWDFVPDFEKMTAKKTDVISLFEYSPRENEEYFGFRFTGFIKIPKDGVYTFFTKSDDGSQLFIGEKMVVDNDGLHGAYEQQGDVALKAGLHPIKVNFFEKTGGDFLEVGWKGPGFDKQLIPAEVLFH